MRKLVAAILLLLCAPAFAQSPCDGKITDKLLHNMNPTAVTKPAAGESYIDPVFGTLITRISNALPSEGENAVIKSLYATIQGWNSDESLILAWHRGASTRRYELYEGDKPYSWIKTVDLVETVGGSTQYPADIEQVWWSNSEPLVLYYPSTLNGDKIIKHTINLSGADSAVVHHDFASLGCAQWTFSMGGDPYQSSDAANQVVGLKCHDNSSGKDWRISYSITNDTVLGTALLDTDGTAPWALPDGTGMFFQCTNGCAYCDSPTGCTTYPIVTENDFDTTLGLTYLYRNYREHQALASTPGGYNTFNRVQFDQAPYGSLVSFRLDTGAYKTVIGMDTGWPYPWGSTHVSSGASGGSGWVALGSVGDGTGQGLLNNELVLANVYTDEVCRIAHIRTTGRDGPWGYWGEAHSQISRDGYRVLFSSDWLSSSTVDMYVADLRPQDTTVITTAVPNGVTTEAYSKTLQALGGLGAPYTWSKTVGTWPDGITMSSGGVISGTPTTVETQVVTVQACDADSPPECDTQQLTLKIQERPSISTTSPLPAATVGTTYGTDLIATGGVGPRTWSLVGGTMCAGLTLNSDGSIDGTPITLQTCNFTARVTDSHAQPIYKDKAFAITVSLPSACLPGGSSVCMKTFPSSTKILARVGQLGIPSHSSCSASIKQANVPLDTIEVTSGLAKRMMRFTGLDPGTLYTIEASCDGLSDASSQVFTTKTSNTSKNIPIIFRPGDVIPTADRVTVEWGESVVTENTTTNTDCASGCTVTLTGLLPNIYLLRHTWKNSGGSPLTQSDTRYLVVQ